MNIVCTYIDSGGDLTNGFIYIQYNIDLKKYRKLNFFMGSMKKVRFFQNDKKEMVSQHRLTNLNELLRVLKPVSSGQCSYA